MLIDTDEQPRATSAGLRVRVEAARRRASARLRDTPWNVNGEVSGDWLRAPANRLPRAATEVIDAALLRGSLTVRGYDRVLRIGWTLADLEGKPRPERAEIRQALALRGGAPL